MARSLTDRINAVGDEKPTQRFYSAFGSALGSFLLGNLSDSLPDTRTSYALLYLLQPDVRFCVDLYVRIMTRLLWLLIENHTHDPANDKIVATSNDVQPRHAMFEAFRRHARRYGLAPIAAISYQYFLYDEVYVQLIKNKHGFTYDIRVLNTLAMEPIVHVGKIQGFRYNGMDKPQTLALHEVAYGHGFNPLDDLAGGSLIESVLRSSNILRNLMVYVDSLFINNGRPGLIASFKDVVVDERALTLFEEQLKAHHTGAKRAFGTFISNIPLDWMPLDDPDVQRQFAVEEPITKQIYRAFGVPMVMAGDTSATNYKESEEIYAAFVKSQVVPHADSITQFLNNELVPQFGSLRIQPDTSEFKMLTEGDKRQSEIIGADLQNTLLSIGQAQAKRGYNVDPELKDLYYVEGIPVPKAQLPHLWKVKYGTEQSVLSTMLRGPHKHTEIVTEDEEWDYSPQKAFKELVNWQQWTLNPTRFKYTGPQFEPFYLRGDYADTIMEGGQTKEAFDKVFSELKITIDTVKNAWVDVIEAFRTDDFDAAERSVVGVKLDFESRFSAVIEEMRRGNLDRRRSGSIVRQLIKIFGARAYRQGLVDGGVLEEPNEVEQAEIEQLTKEQSSYVSNLTAVVADKGLSSDEAKAKSGMWFGKSVLPFYHAGLESANSNMMVEFVGDDGLESCPDCQRLKGQRHRIKDFKRKRLRPQVDGDNFKCKGFKCEHTLMPTVGKARGSW